MTGVGIAVMLIVTPGGEGAATQPRPDLRIAAFSVPSKALAAGAKLNIRVRTRNSGVRRAKRSLTVLYLSVDAVKNRGDRRIGSTRLSALKAHKSRRKLIRAKVPTGTLPGVYRLLACADPGRKVKEISERNNCRVARRKLTVSGGAGPGTGSGPFIDPGPVANPTGDDDGDGLTNAVDCAPNDASTYPGAPDPPDIPAFKDTNCDGIDGDSTRGVFVAPTGNDANAGTRDKPKKTLAAAISTATGQGFEVYAMAGTYAVRLDGVNGVDVYGGYETNWSRSLTAKTLITGAQTSARVESAVASSITAVTTLQLLTLAPKAATGAGTSSYGLRATGSPGLVIDHVVATAGPGTAAAAGPPGAAGRAGGPGANGNPGSCDTEYAYGEGGSGGTSSWGRNGGHGGLGGYGSAGSFGTDHFHGFAGGPGAVDGQGGGPGGPGGAGGTTGATGGGGSSLNGDPGTKGANGAGGASGFEVFGLWTSTAGSVGASGTSGHGGGGGGGGGGQVGYAVNNGSGNGGGGGGAGGEGGRGGRGGPGGGGSFGISLDSSSGAVVKDSVIGAANGGAGGAGGAGGYVGGGGLRGLGATTCTGEVGAGGNGGSGGPGGFGGNAGGGAGGPSFGLYRVSSTITATGNTLSNGAGGAGGPGGSGAGSSGPAGTAGAAAAERVG